MRYPYLCLTLLGLAGCAAGSLTAQRGPASAEVLNPIDACRKDVLPGNDSICGQAKPGYSDCRQDYAGNSPKFCVEAEAGYKDCRDDYANNSPTTCLHAKAGFADCRKDYLNFGVNTCLQANADYPNCRTTKTAAECLGAQ